MPQAEIFPFPPRRPSVDGDLPPDTVALLRGLAKEIAEAGADPSAVVDADIELVMRCDAIIAQVRRVDEAYEAFRKAPRSNDIAALADYRHKRRMLGQALRRICALPASTPLGLFAKAMAVRRVGLKASGLAVSLADDLLNHPALRRVLWPAN
jgi:hypothetical protein